VATSEAPVLRRTFAALEHRDFRIFFIGQLISVTGTWMQTVAQGWLVLILTGSPFLLGVTAAARSLPILLLALPAGIAADRFDRKLVIFVANTASLLFTIVLAALTLLGAIDAAGVIVLAFLLGSANAFEMTARQSFVVQLAGSRHLANAIALNSLLFNAARVVGPALAGIIVATLGVGAAFAINALSFLPVLVGLALIDPPRGEPMAGRVRGALGDLVRYLREERRVTWLLALLGANSIFASGHLYLGPALVRDLGQGAEGLGLLLSATGLGAIAGGLRLAATATRERRAGVLIVSGVMLGASLLAVSIAGSFPLTLILMMGAGWGMVTFNATSNTLIQTLVPDSLRGRTMSLYVLVMMGLMPVGSLLLGAIADVTSTAVALGVGGVAWGIIVVGAFLASPRLRSL
jgi:MFS family permease